LPEFPTAPAQAAPLVVLDTNVVLDWLLFADPQVQSLVQAIEGQHLRWISTSAMRDELAEVLRRPPLCNHINHSERILQTFDRLALRVDAAPPAPRYLTCRDGDDQKFIDLALAHHAAWLLTHDKALLALRRRALPLGPQILTPAQWPGVAR
jgi:putative PIN family toxin of toxin-antitoxin system